MSDLTTPGDALLLFGNLTESGSTGFSMRVQIDDKYITDIRLAINESVKYLNSSIVFALAFGIYFVITVSGTTHSDLLVGTNISLPAFQTSMNIVSFYRFVPAIFACIHTLIVVQLVAILHQLSAFHLRIRASRSSEFGNSQRLLFLPFVFLISVISERKFLFQRFLSAALVVSGFIAAPLASLLICQIKFVPYHSPEITFEHQMIIAYDCLICTYFCYSILKTITPIAAFDLNKTRKFIYALYIPYAIYFLIVIFGVLWVSFFEAQVPQFSDTGHDRKYIDDFVQRSIFIQDGLRELPRGADARSFDFSDRDLQGAVIYDADFSNSIFSKVGYWKRQTAKLKFVNFFNVKLNGVDLDSVDCQGAGFYDTDLSGSNLSGADCRGAHFVHADLRASSPIGTNFNGAVLIDALFQGSSLFGAHFVGASLNGAQLQGSLIGWADFTGASLEGADLRGVSGAFQQKPPFVKAAKLPEFGKTDAQRGRPINFRFADLSESHLGQADIDNVDMALADLRGADQRPLNVDEWNSIASEINSLQIPKEIKNAALLRIQFSTGLPGKFPNVGKFSGALYEHSLEDGHPSSLDIEAYYDAVLPELEKIACRDSWFASGMSSGLIDEFSTAGEHGKLVLRRLSEAKCDVMTPYIEQLKADARLVR